MLPDRVSNPGPLTYESDALPIVLRGPALLYETVNIFLEINKIYILSNECPLVTIALPINAAINK